MSDITTRLAASHIAHSQGCVVVKSGLQTVLVGVTIIYCLSGVAIQARLLGVIASPATDLSSTSSKVQLGSRSRLCTTPSSAAGTRTHVSIDLRVTLCG